VLMMKSSESDGEVEDQGRFDGRKTERSFSLKPGRERRVCEGEGVKGTPDAWVGAVHRRDSRLRLSESPGSAL